MYQAGANENEMMSSISRSVVSVLVGALLLCGSSRVNAQPLLREGDPQPEVESESEREAEADAETIRRRTLARQRAELEEQRRIEQQQLLMRIRGEQMLAEQEAIQRRDRMMRYALGIASAVIVTTLLIAFARSRVNEKGVGEPPGK